MAYPNSPPGSHQTGPVVSEYGFRLGTKASSTELVDEDGNVTIPGTMAVTGALTVTGLSNLNGGIAVDTDKFTVSAAGAVVAASTVKSTGNLTVGDSKFVVTADTGAFAVGSNKFSVSGDGFVSIGSYATPMELAITDTVFASVTNLKLTDDAASSKWIIADYSKITIDDENSQPNNNVAVYRPKLAIETDIENAWGIQLDVNCTGTWATNDLIGIGVFMDLGAGTITSTPGKVAGLQVDVYGEGTAAVTGSCYAGLFRGRGNITGVLDAIVQLENQNGAVTSILGMDIDGACTYAFNFGGSACEAWATGSGTIVATTADTYVKIPVNVEGAGKTLYLLAAADWTT